MSEPAPRTTSPWLVLIAATGSLSMVMLDSTVVGVALPTIQGELALTDSERGWVVSSYLLIMAACMAVGGRIGDRIGHAAAFRVGAIGFGLASLACGMAEGAFTIIAARVAQGLCVALMQPAATALVTGAFPRERLGRVMAVYVSIPLLFLAAGPVLGGAITEWASWRWIFLPNAFISLAAITLTFGIGLRNDPGQPRPFHPLAPALLIVSLLAVGIGVQQLGDDLASAWWTAPTAAAGVAALVWFVVWQYRSRTPLLALTLFHDRVLLRDSLLILFAQLALVGQGIFGPVYLQVRLGMTPFESGLAAMPMVLPNFLVIHAAGRLYDRIGGRTPALIGSSLLTAGLVIESIGMWIGDYPVIAVGLFAIGCGVPMILNPANTDGMSRAPEGQRAEVAGLLQSGRQFGSALGITLVIVSIHLWGIVLGNGHDDDATGAAHAAGAAAKSYSAADGEALGRSIAATFATQAAAALAIIWLARGLPHGRMAHDPPPA